MHCLIIQDHIQTFKLFVGLAVGMFLRQRLRREEAYCGKLQHISKRLQHTVTL
jgi:hypothetical protein